MTQLFKIAMVAACPFPYPRGTPIRIFKMAEGLSQRGHEVHVVTYHLGDELKNPPFKIHRIKEVKNYRKYSPGPTYQKLLLLDTLLAFKLHNVLKTNKIDLIHAHHYEGLFVSLLVQKWTGHPVVYDSHTLLETELPFYRMGLPGKVKKWIGSSLDSFLPARASHIITTTENMKEKLVLDHGIKDGKITAITGGVEHSHFDIRSERKSNEKILIFTGNLAAYQGIELLIKAFKEVVNERKDVRLQIISDSPFDKYESLAEELGIRERITVIKSDFEDLPKYLANADIALNPRTNCDGYPQKLLNYMSSGKPIVSFRGSAKDIEHGRTGLLIEDDDFQAFARAIIYLLDQPNIAGQLGANARVYAMSEYNWNTAIDRIEEIYLKITSTSMT